MLEPRKRTAIDGKVWWCVFDTDKMEYNTILFGKKSAGQNGSSRFSLLSPILEVRSEKFVDILFWYSRTIIIEDYVIIT